MERLVVASAADNHHRMEAARVGVARDRAWRPFRQGEAINAGAMVADMTRMMDEQAFERRNGRHVSDYLHGVVDPDLRQRNVDEGVLQLRRVKFDAIAVTGFSGISVGSILADRLGKALLFVRKGRDSEQTHSVHDLEGPLDWTIPARYVVVDDFICGGETVRRVLELIGSRAEFVGIYLWRDRNFIDVEEAQERRLTPTPEPPRRPRRAN